MGLPFATTTVAVEAPSGAEPYEAATWATTSSGTRAVIGAPSGREGMATGSAEVVDGVLNADPLELEHGYRVVDEGTGQVWLVVWVQERQGLGLDHTRAGLRRVER